MYQQHFKISGISPSMFFRKSHFQVNMQNPIWLEIISNTHFKILIIFFSLQYLYPKYMQQGVVIMKKNKKYRYDCIINSNRGL